MLIIHRFHTDHISCLLGDLITFDTFAASFLYRKFIQISTFSHTIFGHDQKRIALVIQLHSDDLIPV